MLLFCLPPPLFSLSSIIYSLLKNRKVFFGKLFEKEIFLADAKRKGGAEPEISGSAPPLKSYIKWGMTLKYDIT